MLQLEESSAANPIRLAPETFNVRLEELAVIDLAFLAPTSRTAAAAAASSSAAAAAADNPVLALLYEDNKHARHIKTYTLNLNTKVGWQGMMQSSFMSCAAWALVGGAAATATISFHLSFLMRYYFHNLLSKNTAASRTQWLAQQWMCLSK